MRYAGALMAEENVRHNIKRLKSKSDSELEEMVTSFVAGDRKRYLQDPTLILDVRNPILYIKCCEAYAAYQTIEQRRGHDYAANLIGHEPSKFAMIIRDLVNVLSEIH